MLCRAAILCVRMSAGKTLMQWPSFRTRYCTIRYLRSRSTRVYGQWNSEFALSSSPGCVTVIDDQQDAIILVYLFILNQLYMFRAMFSPIMSTWPYLWLLLLSTDIAAGWCHGLDGTTVPLHPWHHRNTVFLGITLFLWEMSNCFLKATCTIQISDERMLHVAREPCKLHYFLSWSVLCYKSKARWFDSRWCHWNFSLT